MVLSPGTKTTGNGEWKNSELMSLVILLFDTYVLYFCVLFDVGFVCIVLLLVFASAIFFVSFSYLIDNALKKASSRFSCKKVEKHCRLQGYFVISWNVFGKSWFCFDNFSNSIRS